MKIEFWEKFIVAVFVVLVFLALCLLLVVFKYPVIIYRALQRYSIYKAGFQKRKVRIADNFEFAYIERGSVDDCKISVLLLHGYTSSKDAWCSVASHIPNTIHIVAVDLPGHGGTTRRIMDDISVPGLTMRVNEFVDAIGLNKKEYHIIGTSLGGFISGIYASMFPENLASVMLVCPGGINSPVKSELWVAYESGNDIKLLPKTNQQFNEMSEMLVHEPFKIRNFIVSGIMQARLPAHDFYLKMFEGFMKEEVKVILQEKLPEIKTKMFFVWGRNDNAFHISTTEVIKEILPDSRIEILENCGHCIHLEKPRKLAAIITRFLEE